MIAQLSGIHIEPSLLMIEKLDELFDVVEQHDEMIDQRPRDEVHRLRLRHRSVHLLVFDSRGRLFLQKRSMAKDENPGPWDSSVAGHVDSGETYDECVVREAAEELGLLLTKTPSRLVKFDASATTGVVFCWIYRTESDGPFALDPDEIDEGRWFEPEMLDSELTAQGPSYTPTLKRIWKRLERCRIDIWHHARLFMN